MANNDAVKTPFSKLTQIGVVVKDMDKTVERLSSFGIGPFEHRAVPADAEEWYGDERMDADFKISAAVVGGVELEFIQPVGGKSPHQAFLDEKGEGIQHMAFTVENLDKEIEKLKKKGACVQMKSDLGKLKVAYVDMGVGGLVFELMQWK